MWGSDSSDHRGSLCCCRWKERRKVKGFISNEAFQWETLVQWCSRVCVTAPQYSTTTDPAQYQQHFHNPMPTQGHYTTIIKPDVDMCSCGIIKYVAHGQWQKREMFDKGGVCSEKLGGVCRRGQVVDMATACPLSYFQACHLQGNKISCTTLHYLTVTYRIHHSLHI